MAVMPNNPQIPPTPRVVEIVAFANVQILDITGPLQVLVSANAWARECGIDAPYLTRIVSSASPVRSSAGLSLFTDALTPPNKPIDTLIIAGGDGVRRAVEDEVLVA